MLRIAKWHINKYTLCSKRTNWSRNTLEDENHDEDIINHVVDDGKVGAILA